MAQEVSVYSGRQEALIKPLLNKFTQETGVKVNLVTGKGDALLSRIKAEGQFTNADVILVADIGRLVRAKEMGLTQAIESVSTIDLAGDYWLDENKQWVALTKRARPIMVKKGAFNDKPIEHLADLTSERFKQSICIRSSSNIYNQSMVSALLEIWGEEKTLDWAKGMVANFARSPKGGDRDQIKALVAGECSVAIANTYYLGGMLSSKDENTRKIAEQVEVVWHDQGDNEMGVHVNVSGAAITKYAQNKANAEKLLAYMLTNTAQKWYAEVNHEYPVVEGVALSPELKGLGAFSGQAVPLHKIGENNAKALMLMDKAGWK
jgi:iron(III) transport system substrate-binding protein